VLGEVFTDPNAETNARGRLFFERGYVVKWSGVWRLPHGLQGAAAARYQDGQHFTRVVLAPGLDQGLDAIPALPRGRTRFTYAFTLDARIEKQVALGPRRATLLLEAYNLLNTNNEVEEDVITGPTFRSPTAVQPPRSIRLGLRYSF
jgi:outer membrane receptor protein involved in Fe transport